MDRLHQYAMVLFRDFEFYSSPDAVNAVRYKGRDGEWHVDTGNPPIPVALATYELFTGEEHIYTWPTLTRMREAPYPTGDDVLVVSFFGSAEYGCDFALGWNPPLNGIDLYVEFKRLHNYPRIHPRGNFYTYDVTRLYREPDRFPYPPRYIPELDEFDSEDSQHFGLLDALETYHLPALSTSTHKKAMRKRILEGPPYSRDDIQAIGNYCLSDVKPLKDLLLIMLPEINLDHALLNNDYMRAIGWQEYQGLPIDREIFPALKDQWNTITQRLISLVDRAYGFYDNGHFREERLARYLVERHIPWRLTKSGRLYLEKEYLKEQCLLYPELEVWRELRKTISKAKTIILPVGKDFRHRTLLSPFSTITARNAPSRYLFAQAKWERWLLKPEPGRVLLAFDYKQEEIGIGAQLSGDPARIQAYLGTEENEFYQVQARLLHCSRDDSKILMLAEQFGAGPELMARRLNRNVFVIRRFLRILHNTYPKFYEWCNGIANVGYRDGKLITALGWQLLIPKHNANRRTIRNFLIQAHGSDILRLVAARAVDRGLNLVGTMHDSAYIETSESNALADQATMLNIMRTASREVIGLELGVDCAIYHRYEDKKGAELWHKITGILQELQAGVQVQV